MLSMIWWRLRRNIVLTPKRLSAWIRENDNHQTLMGLCVIADIQTQLLLSRYRFGGCGSID